MDKVDKASRASSPVTLRDVAERVGITSAAASMALSDSARISGKTKDAVRKAADELGYVPSSAGRALRSQRSRTVAVIVPNTSHHVFGHSYFMHILTGVSTVVNANDMQMIVSTNPDEANGIAAYERVMRSRSADGAIVTSAAIDDSNIETLVGSGLPVVLIGNFPYLPDAVSVGIDDVGATQRVTEHLIHDHGRTRLVHVTGPLDHQTGLDRKEGFLRAVRDHGLEDRSTIVEGDLSESSGAEAMASILAAGTAFDGADVDGVVFANDDMAFGGMQVLKSRSIRVPEDVALVGFDDFGLSRLTTPGITTMSVPAETMARLASQQLLDLIAGTAEEPFRRELPVVFTPRESCGCGAVADDQLFVSPRAGTDVGRGLPDKSKEIS